MLKKSAIHDEWILYATSASFLSMALQPTWRVSGQGVDGFGRFLREGVWMTLATIVGGASFALVHRIAPHLPPGDYSVFTTLIQIVNSVALAGMGCQVVLAKIVAEAITEQEQRDAACAARKTALLAVALFAVLMLLLIGLGAAFRAWVGAPNLWTWLWVAAGCLCLLLQVTLQGFLQGAQDFRWFGAVSVLSGAGRLLFVWVLVVTCGFGVTGSMAGVFLATLLCVGAAAWRSWPALRLRGGTYPWSRLVRRSLILTCGVGTLALFLSLDQILSRRYLNTAELDLYAAAGTIGRVVVLVTVPLTTVMFPKIARSIAEISRPGAFWHALGLVGLVGIGTAALCSVFPALPIRLLQGNKFLAAVPLVPLFAWAVLPLTLTNVLVNNLLARGRFGIVPVLVLLAVGYGYMLSTHHSSAREMIRVLFGFASAACLVSAVFSWIQRGTAPAAAPA